jgi:hypothetical protein
MMATTPTPRRFDLSHMSSIGDAIDEAWQLIDQENEILLVANYLDDPGFGAAIKRSEIANYEAAARDLLERQEGCSKDLWLMMRGGVERRDEVLVACLIYAVARRYWLEANMIAEQVAVAHVAYQRNDHSATGFTEICDLDAIQEH